MVSKFFANAKKSGAAYLVPPPSRYRLVVGKPFGLGIRPPHL